MNAPRKQDKFFSVTPNEPPRKQKPALTAEQLADRAARALGAGHAEEAVRCLRDAVRLSPMRNDLRDALSMALERRAGVGSNGGSAPAPVRPPQRRPHLQARNLMPEDAPEIAEIRSDGGGASPSDELDDLDLPEDFDPEVTQDLPAPRPIARPSRPAAAPARRPGAPPRPASAPAMAPARHAPPRPAAPRVRPEFQRPRDRSPVTPRAIAILAGLACVALIGSAGVYMLAGRGDESASGGADSADKLSAQQDQALIAQAEQYVNQNLHSLAIEKLDLLSAGPRKEDLLAKAYAQQGDQLQRDKQYIEARQAYESALEHDPQNERLMLDLGGCYYILGRKQQASDRKVMQEMLASAERQFNAALAVNATSSRALEGLAKVEIARSNSPGAAVFYRKIIELDPQSPEAESARKTLETMRLKP